MMKNKSQLKQAKKIKVWCCPNCGKKWNRIECKKCGYDVTFDPHWD